MVRRVREHGRVTIILYVSDHDPAGDDMPVSVARKIEWFLRAGDDLDIRLVPIALRAEQVAQYGLPRVPIKETDKRRVAFEARHGEGAVELDALQAPYPGELGRIVEAAINRYREPAHQAGRENTLIELGLRREIAEAGNAVTADHATELDELRASFAEMQAEIAGRQQAISEALAACRATIAENEAAITRRLEQWSESAAPVWETIASDLEETLPDVNDIDWLQPEPVEDDDALYDSKREYLHQMRKYKEHQGKPLGRTAR